MTSVAPYPPAYDAQPQPFQRPSAGSSYEPPPGYYGQRPSEGSYQYPPNASYPPGYIGYPLPPPQQQQQQQQQSVVIVNTGVQHVTEYYVPVMSFASHKVFACISIWFFGVVFGVIAFILAVLAESSAYEGDYTTARTLGRASLSVSIIGVAIFIIIIAAAAS